MISALIRFSIRYYGVVIMLAVLLLAYGAYRFHIAGLDVFPEFSPKQVIIQTEAPGYSAEQVETRVTLPIERSISGLVKLKSLYSESIQGLSIVTVIFEDSTDIYRNRQMVAERLSSIAQQLPEGVETPVPVPLSSSSATVRTLGLTSKTQDLMNLRQLVDRVVVPKLMTVPGVADVNVFGGHIKQLQVQINPEKLKYYQLTINDIIKTVKRVGRVQGGGFIENANQRLGLEISGQADTPEQLALLPITGRKDHLTLGQVCDIRYAPEPPIGAAQVLGQDGIVMMVIGQYDANTLTVSNAVEKALAEFEPIFTAQDIQFYPDLFRPADYIERSLENLSGHLWIGGFFVLLVLYLFLYDWRTALISATAIPLSLVGAIIILLESGVNLNIMVLGGLAIALGEVVDDAIIDTENIFRRLRENRLLEKPQAIAEVIYQASIEVRSSVVYASFIVALAFVPLISLGGVAGRLFAPLGMAYIMAILVSLVVALTLTPALCRAMLGKADFKARQPPLMSWLTPLYHRSLLCGNRNLNSLILAVTVALVLLIGFSRMGSQFLPELREGHYIVHTTSIPGTSLDESIRMGKLLTEQFMKIEGVASASQWSGRAERGADTYGSHYSEYEVRLEPTGGARQQAILEQLRAVLGSFPGILFEVNTFLTERVDETISGYTSPIVVNVYGNDLQALDEKAAEVAEIMRDIPGAADVQLRSPTGTPLIQVEMDQQALAFYGIYPDQVIQALETAYAGLNIQQIFQGNQRYDLAVALTPNAKQGMQQIAELPIRAENDQIITLGEVVRIRQHAGRYNILHQGGQRRQTVTCNVEDGDVAGFMQLLRQRIMAEIKFPSDMYPEFTGSAVEQAQAKTDLILYSLLAGFAILMLITVAIGSIRNMALTLMNLPFALIGGITAVLISGHNLSVGSVVGFITLFGITVRNSIMLVSHYQHLIEVEHKPWNLDTALEGAKHRMPSILMTALVTALAMLPIAFDSDNPGREIMGPMAAIIIGGLFSSTLLNLLLLPAMLLRFGGFSESDKSC